MTYENATSGVDETFMLSKRAWRALRDAANAEGVTYQKFFRRQVGRLLRDANPRFELAGGGLVQPFRVGLSDEGLHGMWALCDRVVVPYTCIGELVASYRPAPQESNRDA